MTFHRVNSITLQNDSYKITTIHLSSQSRRFIVEGVDGYYLNAPSLKVAKEEIAAHSSKGA